MKTRAEWQPFLDQFLQHEGGYVRTGTMETLFGVIDKTWVDAIDRISYDDIEKMRTNPDNKKLSEAVDLLRSIKAMPEDQRWGPVRDWMRMVGRETHAIRGKSQPASGIPHQSKEWVKEGGNAQLVRAAQAISQTVIYKEYILEAGFGELGVSDRTLESTIDAGARYGVAYTYGMLNKTGFGSGTYDRATMERLGYLESKELSGRSNDSTPGEFISSYARGKGGYNFTLHSGRRALRDAIGTLNAQQDEAFFNELGFWRRTFVNNPPPQKDGSPGRILTWDLDRIAYFHGDASVANAQRKVRMAAASAVAASATEEDGSKGDVALVQTESGPFSRSVAVQLPDDMGVVRYSVKYEDGFVLEEGKAVERTIPLLDQSGIELPPGVELVAEGAQSKDGSYRNPYLDGAVLFWREKDTNAPQYLPIGGSFNEYALKLPTNESWYSRLPWGDDTATVTVDGKTQFDPQYSATFGFDAGNPNRTPNWKDPEAGALSVYLSEGPVEVPKTPKQGTQATPDVPRR